MGVAHTAVSEIKHPERQSFDNFVAFPLFNKNSQLLKVLEFFFSSINQRPDSLH